MGVDIWFCFYSTEYGEKENDDLRERFNINKEEFPVYKLFRQNEDTPIDFTGEVKADELAKFVKKNARLWIGMCTDLRNLIGLCLSQNNWNVGEKLALHCASFPRRILRVISGRTWTKWRLFLYGLARE